MKRRKLEGIRVLDMSRVLAGPLAGQMLADLGAEVIKVERPDTGEESRVYGPPFFSDDAPRRELESSIFLSANRNKKGIAVDFTKPEGQDLLRDLIAKSDVLIENFRVGTLAKYRLDYESVVKLNPGLIYCSVTGYGQTGPDRHRSGYDVIFQGEGGLMQSIGYPDDHPAGGPMRVGVSIVDTVTSLYTSIGILGALYARDARGGRGEYIDMSLLDSCIGVMSHHAMHYLISGEVPKRKGNGASGGGVPSDVFHCSDADIVLTVGNDRQYKKFCEEVLERPDLASDPRFATNQARVANRDLVASVLADIFVTRRADEWINRMIKSDLAVGRVNNLAGVFANPQVIARNSEVRSPHRSGSTLRMVANPIRYKNDPVERYDPPPICGEHTSAVLSDLLGLDNSSIGALKAKGVV